MTLTSKPLAVIVLIFMFGGVFFSDLAGLWLTKGGRVPRQIQQSQPEGLPEIVNLRGSNTFGDVEAYYNLPVSILTQAFKLSGDNLQDARLNSLEQAYADYEQEVGTESVKLFVAFYNGIPIDLTDDIYLPESAIAYLLEHKLTGEQMAYLQTHSVPSLERVFALDIGAAEVEEEHAGNADTTIRGRTTFGELLQWGLSREQIEEVLGTKMPMVGGVLVKDYCSEQGLSYGQVKAELQALLNQLDN